MATLTATLSPAPSRALQGISCVLIGMLFFVAQDAMMKSLLLGFPIWILLFIRSAVSIVILVPLILFLGGQHSLRSPFWHLHILRAFLFSTGFSLFYSAFPFMGLAEVTTIFFSAPLITALLAALFLGETIGRYRVGALVVGFAGVLIAMNPSSGTFTWIAVLPLACAVFYSASQVLARLIGESESSLTVGLYTLGFSGVMILPMGWAVNQLITIGPEFSHLELTLPSTLMAQLPQLALLGVVGMCGYILLGRAYQVTSASLVAPFDYTYLPLATALAYYMWGEVPGTPTLIGMTLIVASGLFLGYRELRAAKSDDEATPVVAESSFAPGAPFPVQYDDETYNSDVPK